MLEMWLSFGDRLLWELKYYVLNVPGEHQAEEHVQEEEEEMTEEEWSRRVAELNALEVSTFPLHPAQRTHFVFKYSPFQAQKSWRFIFLFQQ